MNRVIANYHDMFTKFLILVPLNNIEGTTIADVIYEELCRYGVPEKILSDHRKQLVQGVMQQLAERLGIEGLQAPKYHAESCGMIERSHYFLMNGIEQLLDRQ